MARVFFNYYVNLLKSKLINKKKMNKYLDNNELQKIPQSIREMLNMSITQDEVEKAITKISWGNHQA